MRFILFQGFCMYTIPSSSTSKPCGNPPEGRGSFVHHAPKAFKTGRDMQEPLDLRTHEKPIVPPVGRSLIYPTLFLKEATGLFPTSNNSFKLRLFFF